jgi:hypothetical protein
MTGSFRDDRWLDRPGPAGSVRAQAPCWRKAATL